MFKTERRTSEDIEWQNVKEEVRKRDGGMCVLCRILTKAEYRQFLRSRPVYIDVIDPAHHESVSGHIEGTYDKDNIYSLCRAMHQRMDNFENPVTGKPMSVEEHDNWWDRIIQGAKEMEKMNVFSDPNLLKV